jgi:hypothetical protein
MVVQVDDVRAQKIRVESGRAAKSKSLVPVVAPTLRARLGHVVFDGGDNYPDKPRVGALHQTVERASARRYSKSSLDAEGQSA